MTWYPVVAKKQVGLVAGERSPVAGKASLPVLFDLYHVRTEIGEELGRVLPGHPARQIDEARAGEDLGIRALCLSQLKPNLRLPR